MNGFLRMQKGIREKETGAAIFLANIHLTPLAGAPLSPLWHLRPILPNVIFKVFAELLFDDAVVKRIKKATVPLYPRRIPPRINKSGC